jgi:hypothetical protein
MRSRTAVRAFRNEAVSRERLVSGPALLLALATSLLMVVTGNVGVARADMPVIHFDQQIEGRTGWVQPVHCSAYSKPGTVSLGALLTRSSAGTSIVSMVRPCSGGATSDHQQGRALDWGVHANSARQVAQANQFLRWLMATDEWGNTLAMARRLGVSYVIWKDRIWDQFSGWRAYRNSGCPKGDISKCSLTLRHRDHMHVSLSWVGARKQTSFWTHHVR